MTTNETSAATPPKMRIIRGRRVRPEDVETITKRTTRFAFIPAKGDEVDRDAAPYYLSDLDDAYERKDAEAREKDQRDGWQTTVHGPVPTQSLTRG